MYVIRLMPKEKDEREREIGVRDRERKRKRERRETEMGRVINGILAAFTLTEAILR